MSAPLRNFEQTILEGMISEIYQIIRTHQSQVTESGLDNGLLGLSVFYSLYFSSTKDWDAKTQADYCFDRAVVQLDDLTQPKNIKTVLELGRVCHFFKGQTLSETDIDPVMEVLDQALLVHLEYLIEKKQFGGFNGVCGIGSYFLKRSSSKPKLTAFVIEQIYSALHKHQIGDSNVSHWYPNQIIPLTIWNGQSAIILFLVCAVEQGFLSKSMVANLLAQAVLYIDHQMQHQRLSQILSFQMGDIGIGYAMLRAAEAFDNKSWRQAALETLGKRAGIILAHLPSAIKPGLVLGSAGAAVAFDKIFRMSGVKLFSSASQVCYSSIFPAFEQMRENKQSSSALAELCFANGFAGMGSVLIQMLSRESNSFETLLFID